MAWFDVLIGLVGIITGAIGGFVGAKVNLDRNRREERTSLLDEFRAVLELKDKANEELNRQIDCQVAENTRLEKRIASQDVRIQRLEQTLSDVLANIAQTGICARAPFCNNRVLPDNAAQMEGI